MRKNRFLLSLIAATALSLSVIGCDSSSSGGIADTTDLAVPANNGTADERRNLREYLVIGQRGLSGDLAPEYGAGQSAPSGVGDVIAAPGDGDESVAPALLYEIGGISETPRPNANLLTPGLGGTDPNTPENTLLSGVSSGFHQVYASPTGSYVIGMSRSKNRGFAGDTVAGADITIFSMDFSAADGGTFPPTVEFGPTADGISIQTFAPDQGEFVSGAWSSNAAQFYAAISQSIVVYSVNGTVGALDDIQVLPFPTSSVAGAAVNNAMKLIASPDGKFVFAVDNANAKLLTYARDASDGTLSLTATTDIVSDPRGVTFDRSGKFVYVAGRSSGQLAGYKVNEDGSLTGIDLFPEEGIGPIPFPMSLPLGDIASNPHLDQLALSTYRGTIQIYSIDPATGALKATGRATNPLGNSRNSANIEFEPTGRFLLSAYEHDFDAFQPFVNPANGWPFDEGQLFANLDSATNGEDGFPLSTVPNFDSLGRIVYVVPTDNPFSGNVHVFRIADDGSVRPEQTVDVENPYGLTFFQRVIAPPASDSDEPIEP